MKKALHVGIGLAVSAACLWLTFRGFDLAAVRQQMSMFSVGWLAPAGAMFCVAFGLRAARWRWVLSSIRPVPYWTVAPVLVFGFLMNSVLPARGGEFARAFALSRKGGVTVSLALGSIVAERTMDLFGLTTMMLIASRLLPWEKLPIGKIFGIAALLLGGMAAATWIVSRLPAARSRLTQKLISFVTQIGAGFAVVRRPSKVAALIGLSILIWLLDGYTMMLVSRAAGVNLSFAQAAAVNVGIAVGVMIPAAPGYVGTYEFFGKEVLVMLGFAAAASLTFIVFLHFFQISMIVLLGIPSVLAISVLPNADEQT